ncbi:MAG: PKD domain-containing protein [Bacteroidetes bacterium]|nr:PKD domain-containing protein [Bacteroidota bacterium]
MSIDKGCAPLYVNFTNTSTGFQDSCFWNLGINGNTSDNCNPSAIFNQPGTYTIKLTIFKGNQTSTISKTVTVFKDPTSNFNATPRTGCVPFNVQFQDLSSQGDAPINSWVWDMGDGRTETTQNPLHTYTFNGNLTVSLIVTDANGCKNTKTIKDFIKKATPPTVDFSVNKSQTCLVPFNANFQSTITASTPVTYAWNFGNGNTAAVANPTTQYNAPGSYNVTLTVEDENNCSTSKTIPNAVKIEDFNVNVNMPTSACTDKNVNISTTSNYNPIFCNWNFGDGTTGTSSNPTISYSTAGTYTVTLSATNSEGCSDNFSQNIVVNTSPTAAFVADKLKSCEPYTVHFTNSSTNATEYKWNISGPSGFFVASTDAQPSFALPRDGFYSVSLEATSANGCKDKLVMNDYLWIGPDKVNPVADKMEGCEALTVNFNANLTHNWTPTSITWNFGDGTTSNQENPTHTYTNAGDYNVQVVVTYDAPCNSIVGNVGPIHVGPRYPFSGDFDLEKVCVGKETVTFTATGGVPTTEFIWNFGDGTGEGRNTTHVYQEPSQPDYYTVQLIAINNHCKDTIDVKDIFVAYPKASFNFTTECNSTTIKFYNKSKGYTKAIWDFGDGTVLTTMDDYLTHTYPANTISATATLVVENDSTGCVDSLVKVIHFTNIDSFRFSASKEIGCKPLHVTFTAVKDTNITDYLWDLGNGLVFGDSYDAVYYKEGKFEVKMFVRYKNGCIMESIIKDTITVLDAHANFNFDKTSGCVPANMMLKDSSYSKYDSIVKWNWEFNDGTTASTKDVAHTYNALGSFPVKLSVESAFGCKGNITKNVEVSKVEADFDVTGNDVCKGTEIKFINKSTPTATTYLWDFGDGTTSTDSIPTHIYHAGGNYTVSLTVTDGFGCVDVMTKPNFIQIKKMNVDFTANQTFKTCPNLITDFQLLAPPNTPLKSIYWDFGNGNTSNDNNPTPQGVYTTSDSFDVKLVVTDTNNCVDTISKENYIIVSGPSGSFSFMPDGGCAPFGVKFIADFKNTTTSIWDFGNGDTKLDRTLAKEMDYIYRREGEFTPTLVLKDDYGCTVNIISTKKINVARMESYFNVDKTVLCDGTGSIKINDSLYSSPNSPVTEHYWTFTDENNVVTRGNGNVFKPIGIGVYKVNFYAENTFGCVIKDSVNVAVYSMPTIEHISDKVICKGEEIPLNVNGNPLKIEWSPSNTLNTAVGNSVLAKPTETTTYYIKAYNYPQCPVMDSVNIAVRTTVNANAYPDTILCIGDTVQLHVNAENTSLNETRIRWMSSPTISSTSDLNPLVYPTTNTTYYAIVENGKCQAQKLPVVVNVKALPSVQAGKDHIIINGQSVQLDATSPNQVTYSWSPDYKLSCTDCPTPMASPEIDTTYKVTAINEFGCKASDVLKIQVIEDCAGKMVYVPNSFSPNGDGQNDVFQVFGPGVASVKLLRIFNRWGQMVYESTDPSNIAWDGTFKGEKLNPGVFVYYMDVICIDGQRTIKKGDITLLR